MKRAVFRRRWPSVGFWFFVGCWALLVGLLGWAVMRPDLDRVASILDRMDQPGFDGLTPDEVRHIARSLRRHPELVETFSGDRIADFAEPTEKKWIAAKRAHLVVRPEPRGPIRILTECRAHPSAFPLTVTFTSSGVNQKQVFEAEGQQFFELPAGVPTRPDLVEVQVSPKNSPTAHAHPFEIRVTGQVATQDEIATQQEKSP